MKFFLSTVMISVLLVAISSCVTSLQDLATNQNIVTDNQVIGLWTDSKKDIQIQQLANSEFSQIFKEARKANVPIVGEDSIFVLKHYIITFRKQNIKYTWSAAIVAIGKQQFVSLNAEDYSFDNNNGHYLQSMGHVSTYSVAKLEWHNRNSFKLRFLNGDFIKEIALNGKVRIKHEYDPLFGTFVISASSKELEYFLEKYGDDKRLYSEENTIAFFRKS